MAASSNRIISSLRFPSPQGASPTMEDFSAFLNLHSYEDVEAAVEAFTFQFQAFPSETQRLALIEMLMDQKHFLLPFLLSQVEKDILQSFSGIIVKSFPSTLENYLKNPISFRLLPHFGQFYNWLPPYAVPKAVFNSHHVYSQSLAELQAIGQMRFDTTAQENRLPASRQRKRGESKSYVKGPDSTGPAISTREEASSHASKILHDYKQILTTFFDALQATEVSTATKKKFLASAIVVQQQQQEIHPKKVEEAVSRPTPVRVIPQAYPMIQPIKAAHIFGESHSEEFGPWTVYLSTRAVQDLRQLRTNNDVFTLVEKKILELSRGNFSNSNHKKLQGRGNDIPIYEAWVEGDLRLVYDVDCGPDVDNKQEQQFLKIRGIYTHAQLDRRFWASVASQFRRQGTEYRRRCLYRNPPRTQGHYVAIPAVFPREIDDVTTPNSASDPALSDEQLLELQAYFALEKFIPFTKSALQRILADEHLTRVHHLSSEEMDILYHPSSCFVIGRSGTGKTTTILIKMLAHERAEQEHGVKPRQLFVTKSRLLARIVQEYFQKLRSEDGDTTEAHGQPAEKNILFYYNEENKQNDDLPKRYSQLQDHHFPLFLTFHRLSRLLEADFYSENRKAEQAREHEDQDHILDNLGDGPAFFAPSRLNDCPAKSSSCNSQIPASNKLRPVLGPLEDVLTYKQFLTSYWPHFNGALTRKFDPTLVWNEFMGVIKGSEHALDTPGGYLTRDEYLDISHRQYPTFSRQRDEVYKLFQDYSAQKRKSGGYDVADRSHALLRAMHTKLPGRQVDFIYVDEAQDNLIIDAKLLRTLCRHPQGQFWAGDTAQTIAAGSSFKFDDLKSFLFRIEESELAVKLKKRPAVHPVMWQLHLNHRSHGGIVNCARSVVDILVQLFPKSIDALKRECAITPGPRPVFFSEWEEDIPFKHFFASKGKTTIDIGGKQVILVRNEITRDKLLKRLDSWAVILTINECKGLEFDNVLIYNFFADSPANPNDWRVVLNALDSSQATSAPQFEEVRHGVIGLELKFLYVGLTRARKYCWIFDSSENAEPMKLLWLNQGLIRTCCPGDKIPLLLMEPSCAEDWAETGRQLFANELYDQASGCFAKAGLGFDEAISKTYHIRQQAISILPRTPAAQAKRNASLIEAANHFLDCAQHNKAESDLQLKRGLLYQAAEGFLGAKDPARAAYIFEQCEDYSRAATHFSEAECHDDAVRIVTDHRDLFDEEDYDTVITPACIHFSKKSRYRDVSKLQRGNDKAVSFMWKHQLFNQAIDFRLELKHVERAGDLCLEMDDAIKAIDIFLRSPESRHRGIETIINKLWETLHLGAPIPHDAKEYVRLAKEVMTGEISETCSLQLQVFITVDARDYIGLSLLANKLANSNPALALLCLDYTFTEFKLPGLANATISEIKAVLNNNRNQMMAYADQMKNLLKQPLKFENHRLLGFRKEGGSDLYFVQKSSILYGNDFPRRSARKGGIIITGKALARQVQMRVSHRLASKFLLLHERLYNAKVFRLHVNSCTKRSYTARLGIHLEVIMFLDRGIDPFSKDGQQLQSKWLQLFFEALYPQHHALGSVACPHGLPRRLWENGLKVLHKWTNAWGQRPDTPDVVLALDEIGTYQHAMSIFQGVGAAEKVINEIDKKREVSSRKLAVKKQEAPSKKVDVKEQEEDYHIFIVFLEHLATRLVMAERRSRDLQLEPRESGQYFSGIIIPRSWLAFGRIASTEIYAHQDLMKLTLAFLESLKMLLVKLLDVGSDLPMPFSFIEMSTFVSRICRVMASLGCNFEDITVREKVLRIMQSPHTFPMVHGLYINYSTALSWDDIASSFYKSMRNGGLDELVQLVHTSTRTNLSCPLRVLEFRTVDDLYKICSPTPQVPVPTIRSAVWEEITTPRIKSSLKGQEFPGIQPIHPPTINRGENGREMANTNDEHLSSSGAIMVEDIGKNVGEGTDGRQGNSDREITAAITIQEFYRHRLKQRTTSNTAVPMPPGLPGSPNLQPIDPTPEQQIANQYKRAYIWIIPYVISFVTVAAIHGRRDRVSQIFAKIDALIIVLSALSKKIDPSMRCHHKLALSKLKLIFWKLWLVWKVAGERKD